MYSFFKKLCLIFFHFMKVVDDFVHELLRLEKNNMKRQNISALRLSEEEWKRVGLFCDLLSVSSL